MSEYRASAPVAARKTLPRIMKPRLLAGLKRMRTACTGLKAASTTGFEKMCSSPVTPRKENQISMTGPKALPILLVPACWMLKRPEMMSSVIRMTLP